MLKKTVWMKRVFLPMMLVPGVFSGTGGNARAQKSTPRTALVKIVDSRFAPTTITVAVGTKLTWINHDVIPHTVASTHGVFKSKVLDSNENFSYAFTAAGTFSYRCSIHPAMTGKIVVR